MPQHGVAHAGIGKRFKANTSSVSAGAELFALCQTATADGALSAREAQLLRAWMGRSREFEVPARAFVEELIEYILRHGRVTPADLQALGRALEPSLPDELQRRAAAVRVVPHEPLLAEEGHAEPVKNEVLASACFLVAGCQSRRRARLIGRIAKVGEPILLVRRRGGFPSSNAIAVCASNGKQLGFVPEHRAQELAPLLDRVARYRAHLISVSRGMHAPILIAQAFVYRGDAVLGAQSSLTRRIAPRPGSRAAWTLVRIAVALLIAAAVAVVLRK